MVKQSFLSKNLDYKNLDYKILDYKNLDYKNLDYKNLDYKILDYKNLILTLLITAFVLSMNLKINKNLKLLFLFLSLVICIYDMKYLIPFIVSFLIVTSMNYRNLGIKEEVKETFVALSGGELTSEQKEFVSEMIKLPFFKATDKGKLNELSENYSKPQDLYNALYLDEIDNNDNRVGYVDILDGMDDPFRKKISILFSLSDKRDYENFINKKASEMGFLKIINGSMDPQKPKSDIPGDIARIQKNYNFSLDEFDKIKKNLKEACLIIFINNFRDNNGDDNININKIVDFNYKTTKTNNYELFNFDFKVSDYIDNDDFIERTGLIVNFDFNILKKQFMLVDFGSRSVLKEKLTYYYSSTRPGANSDLEELKIAVNFSKYKNAKDTTLQGINPSKKNKLIIEGYHSEINNVIDRIKLFDDNLKRIYDSYDKNKEKLKLYNNIYIFVLFYDDEDKDDKDNDDENEDKTSYFNRIVSNTSLFKKLSIDFKKQNDSLEVFKYHEEKFSKLNIKDVYYNSFFFLLSNKHEKTDFYVEDLFIEYIAPEESPPPSLEKEDPRWYSDSDLKKYFDINEMNNKNEEELMKYYKAMDFDKDKLKEISKHAEQYTEKVKVENISFDKKIDDFSHNIFEIIDDFSKLLSEILYTSNSPASSPGVSDLQGYNYFLDIVKRTIEIITKEDRIISVGFIFIILALFIYFIDSTKNDNKAGGYVSLLDYLNKVKLA